jgi:hypothetical protein
VTSFQTILESLDGVGGAELEIDVVGSGQLAIYTNNVQRFTTTATLPTGVWTHVALTRAGGTLQAYVNGAPAGSGTDAGPLGFGSCPLLMGVDADAGCTGTLNGFLDGRLDDVRIYNRALSPAEIQTDMTTPVGTI